MFRNARKAIITRALLAALPLLMVTQTSQGYIDLAPNFAKIINSSPNIALVEVTGYDRETHTVTLKPLQTLKGTVTADAMMHQIAPAGGSAARQLVQWAVPGSRAVVFYSSTAALVCFGTGWYQVRTIGTGPWKLSDPRPDLPLAYYGSLNRLVEATQAIVNNKAAAITVVAFGADSEGASFDLALNRQSLPGIVRVQRIHTTASDAGTVMSTSSNAANFIGVGAVDEADIPALLEQMKSKHATVRTEAIEDLRTLGRKAKSAIPTLTDLLKDSSSHVRFAAASTLLKMDPKQSAALTILQAGLSAPDVGDRRYAVAAAGYIGAAGAPLAEKLTALLKDPDEAVRLTALESISMLGPAADKAVPALTAMLDDKELMIDAADALGRIGPAAQPALKKLATLLTSDLPAVRWAAVRGMAQIGGPDAHPAVDFMVSAMNGATEVEGYNMMIYFSLLGPVAKDAQGSIQNFRIKNPVLPSSTMWALNPDHFPWQSGGGGGRGGPGGGAPGGGPGGGGPGGGGPGGGRGGGAGGLNELMYAAYARELGPRLSALSPMLATKIMDNTAGDVPSWGYTLLDAAPDESLRVLTPFLENDDLLIRERAAVALGYMGEPAAAAKPQITAALAKASTEREKRVLQWTLRKIDGA